MHGTQKVACNIVTSTGKRTKATRPHPPPAPFRVAGTPTHPAHASGVMWGEAKLNAFVPLLQHAFNSPFKPGKKGKACTVRLPFLIGRVRHQTFTDKVCTPRSGALRVIGSCG